VDRVCGLPQYGMLILQGGQRPFQLTRPGTQQQRGCLVFLSEVEVRRPMGSEPVRRGVSCVTVRTRSADHSKLACWRRRRGSCAKRVGSRLQRIKHSRYPEVVLGPDGGGGLRAMVIGSLPAAATRRSMLAFAWAASLLSLPRAVSFTHGAGDSWQTRGLRMRDS